MVRSQNRSNLILTLIKHLSVMLGVDIVSNKSVFFNFMAKRGNVVQFQQNVLALVGTGGLWQDIQLCVQM